MSEWAERNLQLCRLGPFMRPFLWELSITVSELCLERVWDQLENYANSGGVRWTCKHHIRIMVNWLLPHLQHLSKWVEKKLWVMRAPSNHNLFPHRCCCPLSDTSSLLRALKSVEVKIQIFSGHPIVTSKCSQKLKKVFLSNGPHLVSLQQSEKVTKKSNWGHGWVIHYFTYLSPPCIDKCSKFLEWNNRKHACKDWLVITDYDYDYTTHNNFGMKFRKTTLSLILHKCHFSSAV